MFKNMKIETIASILIGGVLLVVVSYAGLILYVTWPITELSINKAGVFGDSFGILTSLFSGLAFSGMIITILLQRQELQLQRKELEENRKEFAKSANAQERNSQLNALASLLNEYKSQLTKNEIALQQASLQVTAHVRGQKANPLEEETQDLIRRKEIIITKIEEILENTGVQLSKT